MAYQIYDLNGCQPGDHPLYFIDANVWVYWLTNQHHGGSYDPQYDPYVDFVNNLLATIGQENAPKILMPVLLMSELINTYLRNIAMREYFAGTGIRYPNYKRDYRPTTNHEQYKGVVINDVMGIPLLFPCDDSSVSNNLNAFLGGMPIQSDFNDEFFTALCLHHNAVIVTNDGDFNIENIPIYTINTQLLRLS